MTNKTNVMTQKHEITRQIHNDRTNILNNILSNPKFKSCADLNLTKTIMYNLNDDVIHIKHGTPVQVSDIVKDGYLIVDLEYMVCDELCVLETGTPITKIKIEHGEIYLKNGLTKRYCAIPHLRR